MKSIILVIFCFCSFSPAIDSKTAFAGGFTVITHGYNSSASSTDWIYWMSNDIVNKINDDGTSAAVYTLNIYGDGINGIITGYALNLDSSHTSLQATSGQTILKIDWSELDTWPAISTEMVAEYVVNLIVNSFDVNTRFLSFPIT